MDSFVITNEKQYEEKTEKALLLVPNSTNVPQLTVMPVQNESNGLLKPPEPIRARKSFCINADLTISRRPSAVVSAVQQERRASSSSGNIFLE